MRIEENNGNFVIVDFDEYEAYKIACKIEKDGIDFYQKLLSKINKDKAKESLSLLIGEERKHLNLFEDCKREIEKRLDNINEDEDLLSNMGYGVFVADKEDEGILEQVMIDAQRVLKLGLIMEDKSIRFYQACKDKVSDLKTKEAIDSIIKEEEKHKKLLVDILSK